MPTRSHKGTSRQNAPSSAAQALISQEIIYPSPLQVASNTKKTATETIGSRLRKRRRTDLSPSEDPPPASKRVQSSKKAPVSEIDRQGPVARGSVFQGTQEMATEADYDPPQISNQVSAVDGQHPSFGRLLPDNRGAPDFNAVIADIINHGETVDNQYAVRHYEDVPMPQAGNFPLSSASFKLKTQSLPVLENLATQILEIMAKSTYHEIITIATKPATEPGQAYAALKSLFDHTKKVYTGQEPFLNPYELGLVEAGQIEIIRKANMATFVSSVFGSQDVGFYHLNENFLDTFVADGNRLLKSQAQLFLELKTQAYISAVQSTERSRDEILEDLFPPNLEESLLRRRPGAKQLAPSEAEFVQRAQNRRRALLEDATHLAALKTLSDKYIWEAFLRDVSAYVSKNFEIIAGITAPKSHRPNRVSHYSTPEQKEQKDHQQRRRQPRASQKDAERFAPETQETDFEALPNGSGHPIRTSYPSAHSTAPLQDDNAEKTLRAAQFAMQSFDNGQPSLASHHSSGSQMEGPMPNTAQHVPNTNTQPIQYHFEYPLHPNVPAPPPPYYQDIPYQTGYNGQMYPSNGAPQGIPYPTQSAPTQVLYERARKVATSKSSSHNRPSGNPSQRRPWTTEEETSLMAGLDRVKGPHWSQILAMFGPGGTINEVLKDRNQVQLKDKARNLKLFFLKSGIEVPYYLQFVTGELKTRAPARAAKNEAKEKETTDEDRAHVEGLMALASGPPHNEADQAIVPSGFQVPNGRVPMADMGIGLRSGSSNGVELPIDPQVTASAANAAMEATPYNSDAPADGMAAMAMPKSKSIQQQLQ